jgi:hypothetical protein
MPAAKAACRIVCPSTASNERPLGTSVTVGMSRL